MSQNQNTQLAEVKKDISVQVLAKIDAFQKSGELKLPKDYNPENALKSAYIILSDPKNNILEKCNKASIAEALLKMVVYGVSPIKKQCYFIPYGDKLECSVSYAGNIVTAKRYGNLKSIKANAIFEGDEFEFEVDAITGRRKVIKHKQTLESVGSNKVKGAYAVYQLNDGSVDVEVMNISQIQASWNQGGSKGNSPAHKNFADLKQQLEQLEEKMLELMMELEELEGSFED
jgi:recombination protein RecT